MKQQTILFMMAPAHGHLNCTFNFGHRLSDEGYKVIYAVPPLMQQKILQQGFETIICPTQLFTKRNGTGINDEPKLENFFEIIVDRITNLHLKHTKEAAKQMNEAIQKVQPDLIFLDCFLVYNYLLLTGKKPKTILLQTMLDTSQRKGLPPLNSALLPDKMNGKFNARKVKWAWQRLSFKKKWKKLLSLGDNPSQITYRILKEQKEIIQASLAFNRVFHPAIKGLQELILAPKAIDLEEISPTNKVYIGSSMNTQRKEEILMGRLEEVMEELKASYQEETWIYCSLGTLNKTHNKNSGKFFEKMIEVFKQKTTWELILSTGEIDSATIKHNLPNVHVFSRVPQLEVLKYCKVMVTHGGLNSTLEGINHQVPMLVYPLNNNWDQNGDAVRVVNYKLGLMGEINQATTKEISQKLEELVTNPIYAQHLAKIKQQIKEENGMETALELVRKMLPKATTTNKGYSRKETILSIV